MSKGNIRNLLRLFFIFLVLIFGIVYTFNYWWNDKIDLSPINIAVSFFSFGISAMLIADFLTKQLIAPKKTGYSFFIIDEDKFKKIIENIGKEKYQNIKLKNSLLFICTFIIVVCLNYSFLNYYEKNQLKNHGVIKEVKIENKSKSLKGFDITTIHFENIEKELYLNNYNVGEFRKIKYSKNNPKIVKWLEEN
ncbi:hypothetical protein [Soonwooa purpurea]